MSTNTAFLMSSFFVVGLCKSWPTVMLEVILSLLVELTVARFHLLSSGLIDENQLLHLTVCRFAVERTGSNI